MTLTIGVVGTGATPDDPSRDGYAMAYRHARGYRALDGCEIVACADVVRENAERFAEAFDVDGVYEDYQKMVQAHGPDVVSVCVPPDVHAEIVIDLARLGVRAIHCEKPMATTWADCREMTRACTERDVQLTFNHQMRFGEPFARAKELLDADSIGSLQRVEFAEENLYDNGTHLFDLCGYYTDYADVEWVLAQIDYRDENRWFGAHNENQAIAQWKYADGTFGFASTGRGADFVRCYLRLVGTAGAIEIRDEKRPLHVKDGPSAPWRAVDTSADHIYGPRDGLARAGIRKALDVLPLVSTDWVRQDRYTARAIAEITDALRNGRESGLSARYALQTTELIFASWESARRHGRVDLPLDISDNPLEAMVEAGTLQVDEDA